MVVSKIPLLSNYVTWEIFHQEPLRREIKLYVTE